MSGPGTWEFIQIFKKIFFDPSVLVPKFYLSENLYLIGGAILHGKLTPQGTVQFNLVLGNRDRWESRIRSLESMHKS